MSADAAGAPRSTTRRGAVGLAGLTLAVALAACVASPSEAAVSAGSRDQRAAGQDANRYYSLARTQRCLNKAGLHAYRNPGNKVVMGSRGELRVVFGFGSDWIYIAFGRDAREAIAIQNRAVAATLHHYPRVSRKTVIDSVRLRRNVFYYADGGPVTQAEGRRIDACLR